MSGEIETGPDEQAPDNEAGEDMHIHKPKAAHSFREFLSEIGVIVVGVLIALALEQAVEAAHWAHKIETVQHSLDYELTSDAEYAYRLRAMKACEDRTADVIEQALLEGRPELLSKIYSKDNQSNPFDPRPWQASAWETAQTGDVTPHLGQERSDEYALDFRLVATERELQWKLQDDYADIMSARHGVDAAGKSAQLAALERYQATGLTAYQAAGRYLDAVAKHGIRPTPDAVRRSQQAEDACMSRLSAANAGQAARR